MAANIGKMIEKNMINFYHRFEFPGCQKVKTKYSNLKIDQFVCTCGTVYLFILISNCVCTVMIYLVWCVVILMVIFIYVYLFSLVVYQSC